MELRYDLCSLSNVQLGSKGGTVVRALASHQCGPGSNPVVKAIAFAPRGFSPATPVFPCP